MLDVHPPHTPTHTWRDFLLHIATIVVGLLIAVGLEQTVEALHHHHQRHELEENLRIDNKLNRDWADQDLNIVRTIRVWALDQAAQMEHSTAPASAVLRPLSMREFIFPNFGVYLAAQANGQFSLLPSWQQNWQADGNRVAQQIFFSDTGLLRGMRNSLGDLNQSLAGRVTPTPSGMLDISALNPAQRAQVVDQLHAIAEAARKLEGNLILYETETEFILTNPEEIEGEHPAQTEERFSRIERRIETLHPGIDYTFTTH